MSGLWTFPWEKEAMQGNPMPEGLLLADQMAYTVLRNIYRSYYGKVLSREQAAREKNILRREYERAVKDMAFWDKVNQKHCRVLKSTELAAAACRKDPAPENALRLCDVIVGLNGMEEPE